MKKVLIIHHGEGVGGGLIAMLGLIDELKLENTVEVFCLFNSDAVEYIKQKGVNVTLPQSHFYLKIYRLFLHSDASYFNLIDEIRNAKNLICYLLSKYYFAKKELKKIASDYDIVYLNSTFISDWASAAKLLGKKVIIHIREPLSNGLWGFRKAIIINSIKKYCDRIIAISEDNSDRIGLKYKTTVIYDPVVFKNREGKQNIKKEDGFRYFLYLGGMQRIKGFEQLIKSLPFLNDNIRIFFLGGTHHSPNNSFKRLVLFILNPFLWKIGSLMKQMSSSEHIINVGLVDNVFEYYASSLAVISPFSKPHASLPILEALCVGKPVIVSNIKGMDEIVNKSNGFFFDNNNHKSLASVINKVALLSTEEYENLSRNAKLSYLKIKDREITVQRVIDNMTS